MTAPTPPVVQLNKYLVKKNQTGGSYTDKTLYLLFYNMDTLGFDTASSIFKITAPDGSTIYKNVGYDTDSYASPDMDYDSGGPTLSNTLTKNLPLDSNGLIVYGNYTVAMKLKFNYGLGAFYDTYSWTYDYEYVSPVITPEITFNILAALVTSQDITPYAAGVGLVRSHVLTYPAGIQPTQPAPITTTGATIITGAYTGEFTSVIISDLTYTLSNNWYIIDSCTGVDKASAIVGQSMCAIYCGIWNLNQKYINLIAAGQTSKAADQFYKLTRIAQLMELFDLSQTCGEPQNASVCIQNIMTVGEFTDECECNNDAPVPIVPLIPGSGTTVIVDAGTGITVTPVTGGSSTTYTVALSAAVQAQLASLMDTNITTSTTPLLITSAVVGGVLLYSITVAALGITSAELAANSVTTAKITDGNVTAAKLTSDSVTTVKILDANVTTAKINDLAVTTAKINDLAVTTGKIALLAVTAAQIANATITATQLASNAVTTVKITDANVTPAKVTPDLNTLEIAVDIDLSVAGTFNIPVFLDAWQIKQAVLITKIVGAGGTVTLSIPSLGALGGPTGALVYAGAGAVYAQVISGIWTVNNTGFAWTPGVNTGINVLVAGGGAGSMTLLIKLLRI